MCTASESDGKAALIVKINRGIMIKKKIVNTIIALLKWKSIARNVKNKYGTEDWSTVANCFG